VPGDRSVRQDGVGVDVDVPPLGAPQPDFEAVADALALLVLAANDKVAAVADARAVDERSVPAFAVAAERLPVVGLRSQALEVAGEDDVDHARDGVRTVGGRGAAGNGLHALDHRGRDQVEIDRPAIRRGDEAARVYQRQGAGTE